MKNCPFSLCHQRVRIVLLGLLLASFAMAQPTISGVQNNYSYLTSYMPNYGIAPGSIFIVKGTDLANTTTGLQNVPLQYALDGVSCAITVNGTTTQMILYYVTPGQLGGILPSTTPVGDGTITVTNNGQTSAPFPIKVVASAFGIYTADGSGSGLAAVFDSAYARLGNDNPTHVGEVIFFYGSGLGATPSLDETHQLTPTDLSGSLNISVLIGGKPAQIAWAGRSIYPGVDQINVTVGPGTPLGCGISLVVTINGIASNNATIPVAAPGTSSCLPPSLLSNSGLTQQEIDTILANGYFREGYVALTRSTSYFSYKDGQGNTVRQTLRADTFSAEFNKYSGPDLPGRVSSSGYSSPTVGDCIVTHPGKSSPSTPDYLDAGPAIDVSGPAGTRMLSETALTGDPYNYQAQVGDGTPGNYIDPGQYTASGTGGADVGAFSQSWTVQPELVWTNHQAAEQVDRSQGFTVTWSGGNPNGELIIILGSGFNPVPNDSSSLAGQANFECYANVLDGQFTIPSAVLSQLPATQLDSSGTPLLGAGGGIGLLTFRTGVRFDPMPSGLDWGIVNDSFSTNVVTTWK